MDDIPGGGSAGNMQSADWIVRGDVAGLYRSRPPTRERSSRSIERPAHRQHADPLRVWGTNAPQMIFDVDSQAYQSHPYRVGIGLENVTEPIRSATTVYNAAIELLTRDAELRYSPGSSSFGTAGDPAWWTVHAVLHARIGRHRHARSEQLVRERMAGAANGTDQI